MRPFYIIFCFSLIQYFHVSFLSLFLFDLYSRAASAAPAPASAEPAPASAENTPVIPSEVIVAKVHPDFYNTYSAIEEMELSEDPEYWTNAAIEEYYEVESVSAIDYDAWAEMTGR